MSALMEKIIIGIASALGISIISFLGALILKKIKGIINPIAILKNEIKAVHEEIQKNNHSELASLKYSISRAHREYIKDGKIDRYALQCVIDMYDSYRDLGGNGFVENLINDLKRLPIDIRNGRDET